MSLESTNPWEAANREGLLEEIQRLNQELEQRIEDRTAELLQANAQLKREIGERRAMEDALRESEARMRSLVEHATEGIGVYDLDAGRIVECNEAGARLCGRTRSEMLACDPIELSAGVQPDGALAREKWRTLLREAMAGDRPVFEWLFAHKDGAGVLGEVRLVRIPAPGRRLVRIMSTDIRERKRVEVELRRSLDRERELNELKSNFVSMVSHEFRTPLGIIMSGAEILEHYFDRLAPERRREHLEDILRAVRRMSELMEEVLLLGRVESGKLEFRPVAVDLKELMSTLVQEVTMSAHSRSTVVQRIGRVPGRAELDVAMARLIVTNLLTNAIKYSAPGGEVQVWVGREGRDAVIRVEDQGIGIPEADLKELFQKFFRGRNVGDLPGTGLGLVIVKRCVDLHGGTVEVSSVEGRGTTVVVRLPAYPEREVRAVRGGRTGKTRKS